MANPSLQELENLRSELKDPELIARLLDPTYFTKREILGKEISFRRLPLTYSEPLPRAAFCVSIDTELKTKIFLKLNAAVYKISNEANALRILPSYSQFLKLSPTLLDFGVIDLDQGELIGWLATSWIEGRAIAPTYSGTLKDTACMLSSFHSRPLDIANLEDILNIDLPDFCDLQKIVRNVELLKVQKAIEIAPSRLAEELKLVEKSLQQDELDELLRLIHGDFHFNNVLLNPTTNQPVIVDWEDTTLAHPFSDISRLYVFSGLETGLVFQKAYFEHSRKWIRTLQHQKAQHIVWRCAGVWVSHALRWALKKFNIDKEREAFVQSRAMLLRNLRTQ